MWLLTVTLCLAGGGTATCEETRQYRFDQRDCAQIGKAEVEYLTENSQAPGVAVIYAGFTCTRGKDL